MNRIDPHAWGARTAPLLGALGLCVLGAGACTDRSADDATRAAAVPAPVATAPAAAPAPSIPTDPLKRAWFGEQHVHTAYSLDAYIGGARLSPSDAYRFAKGEEVEVGGTKVRMAALDWAAITDHAEYLGEMYSTFNESAPGGDSPQIRELRALSNRLSSQAP